MEFAKYFNGKECKVYLSPFDVRLPKGDEPDEEIDTVVQPDLSVICDKSKLDRRGCRGAPDLVVEIISSSSAGRDMKDKLKLYEKHSVKEYWLVFPYEQVVQLFTLERDNKFQFREGYKSDEIIESPLFSGLKVDCNEIFNDLEGEKF